MNTLLINPSDKVYRLQFDSLEQLAQRAAFGKSVLGKSDRASRYRGNDYHGQRGWFGSDTFEEAYHWATEGWPNGQKLFQKYRDIVPTALLDSLLPAEEFSTQWQHDVAGTMIDMSLAARDIGPAQFITETEDQLNVRRGKNLQRIVVNVNNNCGVDVEAFVTRGILMYAAVEHLETLGYSVELIAEDTVYGNSNHQYMTIVTKLKHFGAHINIDRLMFALASASMLRRMIFGVQETLPQRIIDEFGFTENSYYGHPCGVATRQTPTTLVFDITNQRDSQKIIKSFSEELTKHFINNDVEFDVENKEIK